MEFLLLGGLACIMVIGSFAGFLSIFTKGDVQTRLRQLEEEVRQLRQQVQPQQAQSAPTISPLENTDTAIQTVQKVEQVDWAEAIEERFDVAQPVVNTVTPQTNTTPSLIQQGFAYAKNWLFGGNTLVRSGILVLFIGVAFLLKFAADNDFIPLPLRLAAVALFGIGLLGTGWRLQDKRKEYAWALEGGGIGILYLTIFAASKLYHLIPLNAAFVLLAAVAFLSAAIAVLQSALPLAFLGFAAGFAAPILTSDGHGNHVGLFSYYLILNLAIAFIAFYKSWRPLNVLGFVFTFIIGTLWGASSYRPALFGTTEPFLIAHFLLFTLIAVLYAHRQSTNASDYVDATLVFGTPLVGFGLQYAMLRDSHFGLAYSTLALGLFYLLLAGWIITRKQAKLGFLGECFLALGIGFATLTLPLALDGRWTSAAWAIEGVGLLWVGLRQHRTFPAIAGLLLQGLGAIAFVKGWGLTGYSQPAYQHMYLGAALLALASWACGALINRDSLQRYASLGVLFAPWGWAWWMWAGYNATKVFMPYQAIPATVLAFAAFSSLALVWLSKVITWENMKHLALLLLPVMALTLLVNLLDNHPFAHGGMPAWAIAFAIYMTLLLRGDIKSGAIHRAPLVWIAAIIGGVEWRHNLANVAGTSEVWLNIGWAIVPMALIAGLRRWQFEKQYDAANANAWGWVACVPLAIFVAGWFMCMSLDSDGSAAPLPYIPLINPLDIVLTAIIFTLLMWMRSVREVLAKLPKLTTVVVSLMAFVLLNGMLLRTLHHWMGTPFQWIAIFEYPVVQMSFTFLWAITAFILMLIAHKTAHRMVWMIGAGLMGLVIAKIFLLDLAQHGTVERIISFIGAGLMLLIMGYFAPLPPAQTEQKEAV